MLIAGTKPGDRWYREGLLLMLTGCIMARFAKPRIGPIDEIGLNA